MALLVGCGLASYYCHMYLETDEGDDQQDGARNISALPKPEVLVHSNMVLGNIPLAHPHRWG